MKKIYQAIFIAMFALLCYGCSSDSGTSSNEQNEFHVVFKYLAAVDLESGESGGQMIVTKFDLELKANNIATYCVSTDASPDCEDLVYSLELDEDGDYEYTMSRNGGKVLIAFMPRAVDLDGPSLTVINYENQIMAVYLTTEKDWDYALQSFEEGL